jgi:hypothetical protein
VEVTSKMPFDRIKGIISTYTEKATAPNPWFVAN